ncbi:MAG: hypothetical protein V1872_00070 [bacterium]
MTITNFLVNIPSLIFFMLWVSLPFWLFTRRSHGWISIKRTSCSGEKKECGLELELAVFIFVLPSLVLIFYTLIYTFLLLFNSIQSRIKVTLEVTAIIMDIIIIAYIYLVEKSILQKKRR